MLNRFILQADKAGTTFFWTGCAGDRWISPDRNSSWWVTTREYAERKAAHFNAFASVQGLTFTVVED